MRAIEELLTLLQGIIRDMGFNWPEKAVIEPPRNPEHGDLAVNIALVLSKEAGVKPRDLAVNIAQKLEQVSPFIAKVDVAGPGFLNVTFTPAFWHTVVMTVENMASLYGSNNYGKGKKTQVEYVSANPTGPLHIGHGRGAAVGDSIARILRFTGHEVSTEYYINDAGVQMRTLGLSVWLRARELRQMPVVWPDDFYRGAYIVDIATEILAEMPNLLQKNDEEAQDICYAYAMQKILNGIKEDLATFRVGHDVWYSEKSLVERGAVEQSFTQLQKAQLSFEDGNALWFATTNFGDDKDRVLRKSDGTLTYFASDIAYHAEKYQRGFDYVIDVWGADHHGYIARMRAAIAAIGRQQEDFDVVLIQLVNLLENGKSANMSTRAGTFETLADVVKEVGVDAARFMFLSRKSDSPLDFDLELVKQRTMDNPVYYVQYAHARICAVLRRAEERGIHMEKCSNEEQLSLLTTSEDIALLRMVERFYTVTEMAAMHLAPHHVSRYLMELASLLHSYYAKHTVVQEDNVPTTVARLALLRAVGQIIANGLELLGVSAPTSM